MRVAFLDFDGVLICGASRGRLNPEPSCIAEVNRITNAISAAIVLSTSWRHSASLENWRKVLRAWGITADVIGMTPSVDGREVTRGDEIAAWLRANRESIDSFVVLDDDYDVHPLASYHVRTDKYVGLTKSDADRAIAMLLRSPRAPDMFSTPSRVLVR